MGRLKDLKISENVLIEARIKEKLNELFYAPPKLKEEVEMLDYQYTKAADQEKERSGLHASSITNATKNNFCFREQLANILYLEAKRKGKKPPKIIYDVFKSNLERNERNIPIHLKRIFEEGNSIGVKWQRLFVRGGIGVKEDMDVPRFNSQYDLIYTPDAIVEIDGHKYVVEIKSMNKNSFEKAKSHPAGQKQLRLYMHMEGIQRGFVLVDCKDNSDFKVFVSMAGKTKQEEHLSNFITLMEKVQRYKKVALKRRSLPPCNCGKCLV